MRRNSPGLPDPLYSGLSRKLLDSAQKWCTPEDLIEAIRLYFDKDPSDLDEDPHQTDSFFQWYLRDFRRLSTGRTAVEEFLRASGSRLSAREREMLESWRDARFGFYEVERVEQGRGIGLRDLCSAEQYFVHDVSSSRTLVRWDCVINRIEFFEGKWVFGGNGTLVPRALAGELLDRIVAEAKRARQRPADWVRANSHRLHRMTYELSEERLAGMHVVNFEGDPLEISVARYRVLDEAALVSTLQHVPELEDHTSESEDPGMRSFAWLEPGGDGSRRSYGSIQIKFGHLRLECNSRSRLQRGRKLLEEHAGAALTHLKDAFESLEAVKRRVGAAPKRAETAIPSGVEAEVLTKLKDEHYSKWPDMPLPALAGKTPRASVKTAKGRRAVIDLIRTMENREERARKPGVPAYSFSRVRAELGLEEE